MRIHDLYEFHIKEQPYFYKDTKRNDGILSNYTGVKISRTGNDDTGSEVHGPLLVIEMSEGTDLIHDHFRLQILPTLKLFSYNGDTQAKIQLYIGKAATIIRRIEDGREFARLEFRSKQDTDLSIQIPTYVYQPSCNHQLYDNRCQVRKIFYTARTSVTNIVGRRIYLNSNIRTSFFRTSPPPNDYFRGGAIINVATGSTRDIYQSRTPSSGNAYVIVDAPFHDINDGDSVDLVAGCDKSLNGENGCVKKFNNWNNFGGFTNIPSVDTQRSRLRQGN